MKRIRKLYALKSVMRYKTNRDHSVHSESVAEHLYGMQVISTYFLPLEDARRQLDWVHIAELILFPEIGEIETGDILFFQKRDIDREEERRAAKRVADQLPQSLRTLAYERFMEFDTCDTPEAKFADAVDKMEPIFELLDDINVKSFTRLGLKKDMAIHGKRTATEAYPYLRRFLDAWTEYMVSIDGFAV
jgi:putative hydrolase of HD superfamily